MSLKLNNYDPAVFNAPPYHDDFDDARNYLRVLFKPGYAVQARELTQIQTILQSQIERFGSHIFANGSLVLNGNITEKNVRFLRINKTFSKFNAQTQLVEIYEFNPSEWVGFDFHAVGNSNIRAKCYHVYESTIGDDPYFFVFFDYLTGTGEFSGSEEIVSESETILNKTIRASTKVASNVIPEDQIPHSGVSKLFSIDDGIFYVNGFFARAVKQSIAPWRLTNDLDIGVKKNIHFFESPTCRVGLSVIHSITTAYDDASLYENSENVTSSIPGADRLTLGLDLSFVQHDTSESLLEGDGTDKLDFIELIRVFDGVSVKKIKYPIYSELEKTLARRTYDESGSYTVKRFAPDIRENLNGYYLFYTVPGGTALPSFFYTNSLEQIVPRTVQFGYKPLAGATGTFVVLANAVPVLNPSPKTNYVTVSDVVGSYDVSAITTGPTGVNYDGKYYIRLITDPLDTVNNENVSITPLYNFVQSSKVLGTHKLSSGGDWNKFSFGLESGKAYVNGYEFETENTTYLPVNKPRDLSDTIQKTVFSDNGNFIVAADESVPANFLTITIGGTTPFTTDPGYHAFYAVGTVGVTTGVKLGGIVYRNGGTYQLFDIKTSADRSSGNIEFNTFTQFEVNGTPIDPFTPPTTITVAGYNSSFRQEFVPLTTNFNEWTQLNAAGAYDTGIFDLAAFPWVKLNSADVTKHIGFARIKQIRRNINGAGFRVYLSEVRRKTNARPAFKMKDVRTLHDNTYDPANYAANDFKPTPLPLLRVYAQNGVGVSRSGSTLYYESQKDSLLVKVPTDLPVATVSKLEYSIQKTFTIDSIGVNEVIINPPTYADFQGADGSQTLTSDGFSQYYILIGKSGKVYSASDLTLASCKISSSNGDLTLRFASNISEKLSLISTMRVAEFTPSYRKKTFVTSYQQPTAVNLTQTLSNENGLYLEKYDVYGLNRVLLGSEDVTKYFEVDGGQTNSAYLQGRLILTSNTSLRSQFLSKAKNGAGGTSWDLTVVYSYFEHSGSFGPFIADSYTHSTSNLAYEHIPNYKDRESGEIVSLRNVLDFRPTQNIGVNPIVQTEYFPTLASIDLPLFDSSITVSFKTYLPRIDKIVLSDSKEFMVIPGISAETPKIPAAPANSMLLYTLRMNPYMFDLRDMIVQATENRRYTMKDIGRLEERINRLEYYTQNTLADQAVRSISIKDADGSERFKSGFVVDPFVGHNIGLVDHPDYKCSIDSFDGVLRPAFGTTTADFIATGGTTVGTNLNLSLDGIISLPYTTEVIISQPQRTNTIDVNPFGVLSWFGKMTISPHGDPWFDQSIRPNIISNYNRLNDNWVYSQYNLGYGTQWADWEMNWAGKSISPETESESIIQNQNNDVLRIAPSDTINQTSPTLGNRNLFAAAQSQDSNISSTNLGIRSNIIPSNLTKIIDGSKIVDLSVQFPIKDRRLLVNTTDLKPQTKLYAFFNDENVTSLCFGRITSVTQFTLSTSSVISFTLNDSDVAQLVVGDKVTVRWNDGGGSKQKANSTITSISGSTITLTGGSGDSFPTSVFSSSMSFELRILGKIWANRFGNCRFVFDLPRGEYFSGSKTLRICDSQSNNPSEITTFADKNYIVSGNNDNYPHIRTYEIYKSSPLQNNVIDDLTTGVFAGSQNGLVPTNNPLSQTFIIDAKRYPNGMFLSMLELYFSSKDKNLPVSIQIRPVKNGIPSLTQVVPFSHVSLFPENVNTSSRPSVTNESSKTKFFFSTPVFLNPGEYAIVVLTNGKYSLWGSTIGNTDVVTGITNSKNPDSGVLFLPQNGSIWTANNTTDLMYRIAKCVFPVSSPRSLRFKDDTTLYTRGLTLYNHYYILANKVEYPGTSITANIRTKKDSQLTGFVPLTFNETVNSGTRQLYLESLLTGTNVEIEMFIETSNPDLSPLFDIEKLKGIFIRNVITSYTSTNPTNLQYNGELEPQIQTSTYNSGASRYLTKVINLAPGFSADSLSIFLKQNASVDNEIQVFARTNRIDENTDIITRRWVRLKPEKLEYSASDADYRDITYIPVISKEELDELESVLQQGDSVTPASLASELKAKISTSILSDRVFAQFKDDAISQTDIENGFLALNGATALSTLTALNTADKRGKVLDYLREIAIREFNAWQIKIVLTSQNTNFVPLVQDMRCVAHV